MTVPEESLERRSPSVEHVWNVMAHAQKPDLVFQGNGRVHLNRRGSQFSRLLAAEVCASAVVMVVMLDTPCSEVEWKTTGYPLHLPVSLSLPLPCVTVCHQVSTELYLGFQIQSRTWGSAPHCVPKFFYSCVWSIMDMLRRHFATCTATWGRPTACPKLRACLANYLCTVQFW